MTKYYLLIPCVLLAAFAFLHRGAVERVEEKEREIAGRAQAAKTLLDSRREELQRNAAAQAMSQTALREQQERERTEKKLRDYETVMAKIVSETMTHAAEAERLETEAATVAREFAALQARKADLERKAVAAAHDVERRRMERRNAEMEAQRAASMMVARLHETLTNERRF
jgi:hypothetical protein